MTECQETSGFLFTHACGRPATHGCAQCQKRVCPQHCRPWQPGTYLCLSCVRTALNTPKPPTIIYIDDDPYFYRMHNYGHYTWHTYHHEGSPPTVPPHDPADFTEGDRAALSGGGGDFADPDDEDNPGGGGDFGGDMGAS
jgi:hypothetical protein